VIASSKRILYKIIISDKVCLKTMKADNHLVH